MAVDTNPFPKLDINMMSYEEHTNKGKKMKKAQRPRTGGRQETKGSIRRTLVFK